MITDMSELERRRKQANDYLCQSKKIVVKRADIINTVIEAYQANLELEHHRLTVELKDEIAVDMDGVTKEMYHIFFAAFANKYLAGTLEKIPNNDHRYFLQSISGNYPISGCTWVRVKINPI